MAARKIQRVSARQERENKRRGFARPRQGRVYVLLTEADLLFPDEPRPQGQVMGPLTGPEPEPKQRGEYGPGKRDEAPKSTGFFLDRYIY